jgi:transposase
MSSNRRDLTGVEPLLTDAVWERVAVMLPPLRRGRGRPRVSDRACLEGILYVARWGLPWHAVPPGLGMAHGKTCWRRLDEWTRLGIWDAILEALLASGVKKLQLERVLVDATMVSAKKGARRRAPARSIAGNLPAKSIF